ncbi:MAG: DNA mismatch repair endonuclease MutL [Chloroflexota bacterium]
MLRHLWYNILAMPIQVLPDPVASQIAAGEVVERPSSVVKELVENAIDAGATTVYVEVRGGGRQLIQVADNGAGIAAHEVETAFLRHATSKVCTADDLQAITTLGFRGEALAAIAAVSQVTIVTRTDEEAAGTRLALEGGRITGRDAVGAPRGAVVAVENLFYNVPARLKFLKSIVTEKRLIDELITRYALAYPHVRWRLTHDGRVTFQTSGNGSQIDVLVAVYGPEVARQLLPIPLPDEREAEEQGGRGAGEDSPPLLRSPAPLLSVTGYVSPPSLHWSNRSQVNLYVNGRWIKDSQLTYAVIQAYHTLLPVGRYPLGLIFLSVPFDQVDVNVHPAKTEVRFRDSNAVFGAVQRAVRQTLVADSPIRPLTQLAAAAWPNWSGEVDYEAFTPPPQGRLELEWSPESAAPPLVGGSAAPAMNLGGQRLPIMRVVGQVGAAYVITEGPDGLYLIDQHAAHERILYEQFMAQLNQDGVVAQGLISGAAVHLSPSQATLLGDHLELLGRLGFQVEAFGPHTWQVRAMPALLARLEPAQALLAVVEDLERETTPLQDKVEAKIIRRVCKTAAIKAGQSLTTAEMEALVRQLEGCQNPHTCPHGRPTLIHLSVAQLARQFGRT